MPILLDQPLEINPAGSAHENAATLMGGAANTFGRLGSDGYLAQSMNQYLNPYYKNVIKDTTQNMRRDMNIGLNNIGDQANAAGAFGGSRHGLLEANYMSDTNRNIGQMTNQMNMEQFNTAAGLAQAQAGIQGNAASSMAGLGSQYYNVGNDITDRQAGVGSSQQQLLQQILDSAAQQLNNYTDSPMSATQIMQALLATDPRKGNGYSEQESTSSQGYKPGLMDWVGLGLQGFGAAAGAGMFDGAKA